MTLSEDERRKEIPASAIREELSRILSSRVFVQSERLGRFLRFTIDSVLTNKSETLKEYVIGTEVYDRKAAYLPSQDSIVRTEARRLRSKLKDYYESEGSGDPVLIYFRPGSYVPVFRLREGLTREPPASKSVDGSLLVEGKGISIAVIPFKDMSGQPLSSTCAMAITDELIHELMRTEGCRVTSATLGGALEQYGPNLTELAEKLGVQIFFEGSVRHEGEYLRVTARIITADGFQLWSQRFDSAPRHHELFDVAGQIARSLVNRTRPELSSIRKLKASAGSDIWTSYPTILSAEALLDEGTPGDIRFAVTRFQEVLAASPQYPRPFCGIAQCYYELALQGTGVSAEMISEAKQKALQASELDPEFVQAHACTATLLSLEWNWKDANDTFRHALALGPHAATYRQYALFLAIHARFSEAWHYLRKAQHVDAFSQRQKLAWIRFFHVSRRHQELEEYGPDRLLHGQFPTDARLYLALIYIEMGRLDEALNIAREVQRRADMEPAIAAFLAEVFARCGELLLTNELIRDFQLLSNVPGISRFRRSLLALALDNKPGALALLSAAFSNREPELIWLAVDPRLDALRSDPEFMAMTGALLPQHVI